VVARIAAFILGSILSSIPGSIFGSLSGWRRGNPPRLLYNLGVTPVDAKGTRQDYLAHPSAIPVQIMTFKPVFSMGG
jgi:hypothetical protein